MRKHLFLLLIFTLLIAGCSAPQKAEEGLGYEETKKMVVDILKTDDGKKAIQEILADDSLKQQLVMDQAIVSESIEKTLVSEKGIDFWKKSFENPKFVESFAKSMQEANEKLIKNLMNDPEFRGKLVEVMKEPDLKEEVTEVLKSNEYREHLQKVITETFESPLFQAKIQNILITAAEEMQSGKKKES
jgi:spore germination protein D